VNHYDGIVNARKTDIRVFYALHRRYRSGDYGTWNYIAPALGEQGLGMELSHSRRHKMNLKSLRFFVVSLATAMSLVLPAAVLGQQSPQAGTQTAAREESKIRPFRVKVPEKALVDLRRRLAATRWPTRELVKDRSQGVQLATMRELVRYWTSKYDWRKAEAKLNALSQFVTTIDGIDIHFIHVRSKHENALPLIMTHGWPGSVIELLETIGPLTDPTRYGGTPADAFHLVLPSLPGYGFSGEPAELGWDSGRIARAWATLMERLGYSRYVAQGGDVGAYVTDAMGRQGPRGLAGIHLNLLPGAVGFADRLPAKSEQERAAHSALATFRASGSSYGLQQGTRPQTIGYSLLDSPVGLAAWLLDHDTDAYYKISGAFVDGKPVGNLTRENIVDNITLYWLTGTGASAARWYWERQQAMAGWARPPVRVPVAFTTFPGEIWPAPRSWVEAVYPGLAYFNEVDKGGHFAAWEQPQLFSEELRAAFRSLRGSH
jgi:pimeloyl-ACP methyl ester carboxylesterase